ncbi:MAG: NAD(P)(+) transhydrogenase (Re/Si-specific) subunit beta [Puniceicoccales bacterium]|nr:NAD(P)(+) transhydrogenase (Re/Si-specific) subunit beta [Puniceicoccales bacterium]
MHWFHVICILGFFAGLKLLGSVKTARLGNAISAISMLLAILAAPCGKHFWGIWAALGAGAAAGALCAFSLPITAAPQLVALLNSLGGLASLLVAAVALDLSSPFLALSAAFAIFVGGITFTGSTVACAKLAGWVPSRPVAVRPAKGANPLLTGVALLCAAALAIGLRCELFLIFLSLALGLTLILPIGGGDMPVVISLLNSLSGVAAALAGLLIGDISVTVTGCLVGASGTLLTFSMCRAMNRSLATVLFGSTASSLQKKQATAAATAIAPEDARWILEAARRVCIVPGYGLALAQAQHAAKAFSEALGKGGADVFFVLHPVAGRMPGHMSVLLAEADVAYDQLVELGEANRRMDQVDVALVVGANDTVNPAAAEDSGSPLYGMPVVEVWRARTVLVLKRGSGGGFSGLDNPLFARGNVRMVFGDAKKILQDLVTILEEDR